MKGLRCILILASVFVASLVLSFPSLAYFEFNQQGDNQRDDLGYYYAITGGFFPTGTTPNGDNASGGTFRFLLDDPYLGYPLDTWRKDDWFPQNAGLALTLINGSTVVYDNNGIEDGSGASFYDYFSAPCDNYNWPGLYRGYCMANNYDWIYATYFKLEEETTFDTIIGYFDPTSGFDPFSPFIGFRMNIWSSFQDAPTTNPNSYMPAVASFTGDVFSTDSAPGVFQASDTGVDRVFPECYSPISDDIWRLVFKLSEPLTLPAGVYFFSHDAIIVTSVVIDIKPGSYPNSINLKSNGKVPVAVLCDSDFYAEDISPESVVFAGASPVKWIVEDINGDSYDDLLLHFKTQDLMLDQTSTEATLTGFTVDGEPIKGVDSVRIVPSGNGQNK